MVSFLPGFINWRLRGTIQMSFRSYFSGGESPPALPPAIGADRHVVTTFKANGLRSHGAVPAGVDDADRLSLRDVLPTAARGWPGELQNRLLLRWRCLPLYRAKDQRALKSIRVRRWTWMFLQCINFNIS